MLEQELISLGLLFFFTIVGGVIATRFKQPAVIGLLIIGAIIGPNSLNLVKDYNMIEIMIELGAILLLFVIGLEFVIPKFIKLGFKAMMIGIFKIGIIMFFTYQVSIIIGLSQQVALILGIIFSLSSTVAIVRILQSKGLYRDRQEVPLLIGILLIEDIFAVMILTFLSGAKGNTNILMIIENLIIAIGILSIAYFIMLRLSKVIVSWLIKNSDDESITFIALAICVSFSSLAYSLGLSPSIGAFLAGSIVASLSEVKLFEHAIKPYSIAFSSLFFISIGTMVNFLSLKENILLIGFLIVMVIILRFVAMIPLSHLFANFNKEQAIFSSIALISVSEFSLLIAQSVMKFNLGVDFVSIVAFIIFITTIVMSLSINQHSKIAAFIDNNTSKRWVTKPKSLSNYIQLFFEEMDIESSDSNRFKKKFFNSLVLLLLTLLLVIGWRKTFLFFRELNLPSWSLYLIHLLFASGLGYILYRFSKVIIKVYNSLIIILANIDSLRSIRMSKYILKNFLITFALFIVVMASPAIIVLFDMPVWVNIFPFGLLIISLYRLNKVFNVVTQIKFQSTFPRYKKLNEFYIKSNKGELK